jgi:hypothetical protein
MVEQGKRGLGGMNRGSYGNFGRDTGERQSGGFRREQGRKTTWQRNQQTERPRRNFSRGGQGSKSSDTDSGQVMFCVANSIEGLVYSVNLQDERFMEPASFSIRIGAAQRGRGESNKNGTVYGTFRLRLVDGRKWMPWTQLESLCVIAEHVAGGLLSGENKGWITARDNKEADDVRITRTTLLSAVYAWSLASIVSANATPTSKVDKSVAELVDGLYGFCTGLAWNGVTEDTPKYLYVGFRPAPDNITGLKYVPVVSTNAYGIYIPGSNVFDLFSRQLGIDGRFDDLDVATDRELREQLAKDMWESIGLQSFVDDVSSALEKVSDKVDEDAVLAIKRMLFLSSAGAEYIFRGLGGLIGCNVIVRQEPWNNRMVNRVFLEKRKKVYHVGP